MMDDKKNGIGCLNDYTSTEARAGVIGRHAQAVAFGQDEQQGDLPLPQQGPQYPQCR